MAKSVHDDVLDGALNIIKNNCTRMVACSTQPTTYTEANATYAAAGTAGTDYTVTCQIVTTAGRTDERSNIVQVRDR